MLVKKLIFCYCLNGHTYFLYEIMFGKMSGCGQPKQKVENETRAIEIYEC